MEGAGCMKSTRDYACVFAFDLRNIFIVMSKSVRAIFAFRTLSEDNSTLGAIALRPWPTSTRIPDTVSPCKRIFMIRGALGGTVTPTLFMLIFIGFMVHGSWFMVQGSWFMVQGSWFRVQGSWFTFFGLGG
jgi:hypothetical protein